MFDPNDYPPTYEEQLREERAELDALEEDREERAPFAAVMAGKRAMYIAQCANDEAEQERTKSRWQKY